MRMEMGYVIRMKYPGCTDPEAVNYNPDATSDNGTCIIIIVGCGNPAACNYDPAVTINAPGLCDFPNSIFEDCDGNCFNDEDGDGVCDEMEILGCTNPGPWLQSVCDRG